MRATEGRFQSYHRDSGEQVQYSSLGAAAKKQLMDECEPLIKFFKAQNIGIVFIYERINLQGKRDTFEPILYTEDSSLVEGPPQI